MMNEKQDDAQDLDQPIVAVEKESAQDFLDEVVELHTNVKSTNASADIDTFDWDAFESEKDLYDVDKTTITEKYADTLSKVGAGEIVEGTVISLNKREVVVNIGYKSEGVINISEFRYNTELKEGDKVEVYVENTEDKKGQLLLSHKQARSLRSWDRVNEALSNDEIIKGFIKCRTKGGMIVDIFGIEAFLPGSQIDVKPIRDYDIFVGKNMEFKVVKINPEFHNVVVSHKVLIEAEIEAQKKEIIAKLEKGQVLEGTVKNITSYGVFIDLGGVDGLIHITDLSWGRVAHPDEIVTLDQKLNVVILDFDDAKKRIALGLKQLSPHPWESLNPELKIGDKITGRVVVMADYGAFIEIAPGVEGLIHVSEMSWSQHLRSAQDFLKVGDVVEAVILTLDKEDRKMSLGIKQLKPDPWENFEEKYPVGSHHKSKVRNFTNFGVFVEIEEGVDGLVHISDLSWTKKIKHPNEFTQIGAELEVVVLEVDKENRRLSLGHKQVEENPWDVFETIFTVDSIHEGTVTETMEKGALVALPYGVEGFVTPKHLVKQDGASAKIDDKLPFKVIEFNKNSKRIILSHSRTYEDAKREGSEATRKEEAESTQKAIKKVKASLEKTTLGDISGLAALKTEMESSEKRKEALKETPAPESVAAPAPEQVDEPTPAPIDIPAPEQTDEPAPEPTPEPIAAPAPEQTDEPAPEPTPEPASETKAEE
ncbi:MAG: 30S ribosomal protein S1 [Prevotellaceae bacterium]|jgi:small subunit ribosomal protein S1|nr:30S ribosomal protein S1 [Prevotellaceae bacterium]